MFRKKVVDYKHPMLPKFTSQNGRILSWKNKQINLKKNIFKIKNNLINLKLDPQNELKQPKKIGSLEVKINIHTMLETPIIQKKAHNYELQKSKTIYNMTKI